MAKNLSMRSQVLVKLPMLTLSFGGVSNKSNVCSYGMMVLEMVGGRKNVDVATNHTNEIYFPDWVYKQLELSEELGLTTL
ncbi:hypothetical protein RJ640_017225 [Escallonia rubra]|uniref:Uncharacterized protein n=1 Tax=Escallonia rubra TaxID=112253 RepID=A0AA88UAE4_9ASTE|nr:hypothetical protein RJ640_017225 [Escallonia rubra]